MFLSTSVDIVVAASESSLVRVKRSPVQSMYSSVHILGEHIQLAADVLDRASEAAVASRSILTQLARPVGFDVLYSTA